MVAYGLHKHHLSDVAHIPELVIRPGADTLMALAQDTNVPFHIFSAGLYDVIHAILEARGLNKYGCHVVSNIMAFDDNGKLLGFKGNLIHSFNKNSEVLRNSSTFKHIVSRCSILLLGDSLGDVNMVKGLHCSEVINVGFLNVRVEERMKEYLEVFDIVLINDAPMDYPIEVLQFMTK